jgi:magnesium and cobalt transporter
MVALPADASLLDLMRQVVESGHSRFPVHGEDKDEILGILLAKDLLRGVVVDHAPGNVRELLRPAVLIPESKRLDLLLREFRQSRNHMAIVIDEYGGVAGLVTAAIGHLPEAGEELTLGRFGFRVARADARRLHALHVSVHSDA